MRKFYAKKTPKCRSLTLNQIYGLPDNKATISKCEEVRGDSEEFLQSLKEIGCLQGRKKDSVDRGKGL
jgi:hypothetical protein